MWRPPAPATQERKSAVYPGRTFQHLLVDLVIGRVGVGNGNRTRNRRSHSPVLCQLSYSHRRFFIIAIRDSDVVSANTMPLAV